MMKIGYTIHDRVFTLVNPTYYTTIARPNENFFSEHRHIIYFSDRLFELSKNIAVLDVSMATTKNFFFKVVV